MNYIITEELANGILQYLAKQPFGEVVGLVQGLQSLKPTEDEQGEPAVLAKKK